MSQVYSLDTNQIKKLLPHRYPFLLVDRAVDLIPQTSCTGIKAISAADPILVGHFPEMPIFPGVCQIEAAAQVAGIAMNFSPTAESEGNSALTYLARVSQTRFRKQILPGHLILIKIIITAFKHNLASLDGKIYIHDHQSGKEELASEMSISLVSQKYNS